MDTMVASVVYTEQTRATQCVEVHKALTQSMADHEKIICLYMAVQRVSSSFLVVTFY